MRSDFNIYYVKIEGCYVKRRLNNLFLFSKLLMSKLFYYYVWIKNILLRSLKLLFILYSFFLFIQNLYDLMF